MNLVFYQNIKSYDLHSKNVNSILFGLKGLNYHLKILLFSVKEINDNYLSTKRFF